VIYAGENIIDTTNLESTINYSSLCSDWGGICCERDDALVLLTERDFNRVPVHLTETFNDSLVMKSDENGCVAYQDSSCTIYVDRPQYCRDYPLVICPVVGPGAWDSEYFLGYIITVSSCLLGDQIDFEQESEQYIQRLLNNLEYANTLLRFVRDRKTYHKSQLETLSYYKWIPNIGD
tara:strand:- start:5560 stop:6093 length:534 start_codon:yes stop_codon:yes gene_type:complete